MPRFNIIKMCNLSPLHIGMGRDDYDTSANELHSDSISAALASVGVMAGIVDNVPKFLESMRISSAFPFWRESLFLPKPQGKLSVAIAGMEEYQYRKKLKSIRYIDASIWSEIANVKGATITAEQVQGQFLVSEGHEMGTLCKSQVMQRVSVPRDYGEDASPFFFDWHYYSKDGGLYCLVDADETTFAKITKLFSLLGESGIGADKNIGGGKFNVSVGKIELKEPAGANATMLLSLYIPTEEEFDGLLDGFPKYSIMQRGGYMAGSSVTRFRHLRKKTIHAFAEGSVFDTTKTLDGKIANLTPTWNDPEMHPVFRSGRALSIKIKNTEQPENEQN